MTAAWSSDSAATCWMIVKQGGTYSSASQVFHAEIPLCIFSCTLRTLWSWQNYCLNHCARTCCSLRIVTRCCFTNWRVRCEQGGRNIHFLSINLINFHRSRGIVLVKVRVSRSRPNPHRHRQRHWQSASSLGRCLWLARLVSVWKVPPGDVTARSE